MVLANRGP